MIYQSIYALTFNHGHELWDVTSRMTVQIQAAEMSFPCSYAGLSLRDRVKGSGIQRELKAELLFFNLKRNELKLVGHLIRMPHST